MTVSTFSRGHAPYDDNCDGNIPGRLWHLVAPAPSPSCPAGEGAHFGRGFPHLQRAPHITVSRGPRVIGEGARAEMKRILAEIQSGRFARDWMLENQVGQTGFKAMRRRAAEHPIEQVGEKLRAMMPWIADNRLVDKTHN